MAFDQVAYIASCTKLITSIASLQIVERGLVKLEDPLDDQLPELAAQPIIQQKQDETFEMLKAKRSITLRHLLTHTSGATYAFMDPRLLAWRKSRGESPGISGEGDVAKDCAYPRAYEAGESWAYSTGLDWASLLVSRLAQSSFEEYVEEHIAKPLGITSFTWHLARKPAVAQKVMRMNTRQSDGVFVDSRKPFGPMDPKSEGGGGGMYASVHDYTRVLSDLLKDQPVLLKRSSVDRLFTPQLVAGSNALVNLSKDQFAVKPALDNSLEGVSMNYTLGGLLLTEDVQRENYFKPKGTISWTGLPNMLWSINRERGLALFIVLQTLPWADRRSFDLVARFETAVWRNMSELHLP